jgi:TatD DNase family protein
MPETALVDYHCHLDLYSDHNQVLQECVERNIHVLAVTTTPAAWPRNHELSAKAPHARLALGFHPQLITERMGEFALFERYLCETAFVGEVGLDASPRFYSSFKPQLDTFGRIVSLCAAARRKVLSVHSVRATAKVLEVISEAVQTRRIAVVLHWFSGSNAEAKRAIALGCYFSINAKMLQSPTGRAIAASLPINRILTETDGPFTATNERPSRPIDVEATLKCLASIRRIDVENISGCVAGNARRLDEFARGLVDSAASEKERCHSTGGKRMGSNLNV